MYVFRFALMPLLYCTPLHPTPTQLYSPNDANAPPIRAFMSYQAPVHYNSILPNECMDTAYQFLVDSVDCLLVEQRVSHDELMRLEV